MDQVALVVGASSGLGSAIARQLAAEGWRTYAAARSFSKDSPTTIPPDGCVPIYLDVTDSACVKAAVCAVQAAEGRIDALVNCAAFLTLGSCEETDADALADVLRTNLLGSVRVIQAALPIMRAQGSGRIVQLSSLNGRFAIPFQGAYTASKHALKGWCEALAMEVRPFGIGVTLIEPGDCRSGSAAYRHHAVAAQVQASPYRARYEAAVAHIEQDERTGMEPVRVARAVARALQRGQAPMRVVVARIDQRLALWLHGLLPGRLFARIIAWYYRPRKA